MELKLRISRKRCECDSPIPLRYQGVWLCARCLRRIAFSHSDNIVLSAIVLFLLLALCIITIALFADPLTKPQIAESLEVMP